MALAALERAGHFTASTSAVLQEIDSSFEQTVRYWGRYVNPGMAALGGVFGMDLDVKAAFGGRLRMQDDRDVIDCSGGFGCNLRGYNSPDVLELLENHDPERDYFAELEQFLRSHTRLQHALPAVSGATAVDIAVAMAMLANPKRRKVVTFEGNFGGKTLFSLNLSKHGPQLTESDQDAFRPYYAELVYIDPFATDAEAQLHEVLAGGDVALIWFEMLRGGMCERLPQHLISAVAASKDAYGYLIGVDEVLTGGFRSGSSYLLHESTELAADVVSIGKTLSDMTVPMAAALVSEQVLSRARDTDSAHVERLRMHFRYGLGAHVALNAFSDVFEPERRESMARNRKIIERGLQNLVERSALFSEVRGEGTLLRLVMNPRYFPFHHRSKPGNLLEMALSHLIFVRAGVLVFLLRFLHRVAASEQDALELVRRLEEGLRGVTPQMVYRYALSRILGSKSERVGRLIAGRLGQAPRALDRAVHSASGRTADQPRVHSASSREPVVAASDPAQ